MSIDNIVSLEITLGNVLTIGAILGGWLIFLTSLKGQIQLLAQALEGITRRLLAVENTIAHFTQNTVELAKHGVRIDALEHKIEFLKK